jgi:hypothetical protein
MVAVSAVTAFGLNELMDCTPEFLLELHDDTKALRLVPKS